MLTLIKNSDYKIMPWKNGLGVTSEIEIFPKNSDFAAGEFDYRISSAKVSAPAPFSKFSGFDRILCVWKGRALLINGKSHLPYAPFEFSGDDSIESTPQDEVIDFGIIYRRGKINAEMKAHSLSPAEKMDFNFNVGTHFIFCGEGGFVSGNIKIETGDTVKVTSPSQLSISSAHGARLIVITVVSL